METLFTTFLSSTDFSVNISTSIHIENSSLNFLKPSRKMGLYNARHNVISVKQASKLHLTMEISTQEGLCSVAPQRSQIEPAVDLKEITNFMTDIPLQPYFMHQIYHLSARRRYGVTLFVKQTPCFCFGEKMENHHSMMCSLAYCCDVFPIKNMNLDKCCLCACQFEKDRFCPLHEIYIQKTSKRKKSCSWLICLAQSVASTSSKDGLCSPLYQFPSNDECLDDDSSLDYFEIEYDDGCYELEVNFTSCNDIEDDNNDNLIYELPDDSNEDDEICFHAYEFEYQNKIHESSKNFCTFENNTNTSITKRPKSKYHQLCVPDPDPQEINQLFDAKKKVRFAETVVHHLYSWQFAYKESRSSSWVKLANDRAHFNRRTQRVAKVLDPVLKNKIAQIKRLS